MTAQQTLVMTGATRGIGHIAARKTLDQDPNTHLVLLARPGGPDPAQRFGPHRARVTVVEVDLASLASVRAAADRVVDLATSGAIPPVRMVGLNAGVQHISAVKQTADGFESTFGVNVLANHVLLQTLHQGLQPPVHAVVTVSDTHFGDLRHNLGMMPGPQWSDPQVLARAGAWAHLKGTKAGHTAYATSKLAAIYLVHAYARCFQAGWTVQSFNPGFVPGTGLARDAGVSTQFIVNRIMPLLTFSPLATSVQNSGEHLKDAMTGAVSATSGVYIDRHAVTPSSPESYDPQRESELWEVAQELTAPFLPDPAKP